MVLVLVLQQDYDPCQTIGEEVNNQNLRVIRLDKVIISRRRRWLRRGGLAHASHVVRVEEKVCDEWKLEGNRGVKVKGCVRSID